MQGKIIYMRILSLLVIRLSDSDLCTSGKHYQIRGCPELSICEWFLQSLARRPHSLSGKVQHEGEDLSL